MLIKEEIEKNKNWLSKSLKEIKGKSIIYFILSDPTRIKILFLLKYNKELCVTDLSEILNITMGATSHQLSLLEKSDFIVKTKKGQMVCYSLNKENNKILNLLKLKVKI